MESSNVVKEPYDLSHSDVVAYYGHLDDEAFWEKMVTNGHFAIALSMELFPHKGDTESWKEYYMQNRFIIVTRDSSLNKIINIDQTIEDALQKCSDEKSDEPQLYYSIEDDEKLEYCVIARSHQEAMRKLHVKVDAFREEIEQDLFAAIEFAKRAESIIDVYSRMMSIEESKDRVKMGSRYLDGKVYLTYRGILNDIMDIFLRFGVCDVVQ
jgi:hypothetical protein